MKALVYLFILSISFKTFATSEEKTISNEMREKHNKELSELLDKARAIKGPDGRLHLHTGKETEKKNAENDTIFSKLTLKAGKSVSVSKSCLSDRSHCSEEEASSLIDENYE
jgi:hypothetical protein